MLKKQVWRKDSIQGLDYWCCLSYLLTSNPNVSGYDTQQPDPNTPFDKGVRYAIWGVVLVWFCLDSEQVRCKLLRCIFELEYRSRQYSELDMVKDSVRPAFPHVWKSHVKAKRIVLNRALSIRVMTSSWNDQTNEIHFLQDFTQICTNFFMKK